MNQNPIEQPTERMDHKPAAVPVRVDVFENKEEILLTADFPGVPPEQLNVRLDGSELLIEGAQQKSEFDGFEPLVFSRVFRVPRTVDPEQIQAELQNGVLRVQLGKSEAAKPRRIQVTNRASQ
ncbi:MAG: Hsp20/alpha crystallin family protein [Myxococcota bacterium]